MHIVPLNRKTQHEISVSNYIAIACTQQCLNLLTVLLWILPNLGRCTIKYSLGHLAIKSQSIREHEIAVTIGIKIQKLGDIQNIAN